MLTCHLYVFFGSPKKISLQILVLRWVDPFSYSWLLSSFIVLFHLFSFLFIIIIFFYFTILYWFWCTSTWIRHGCTCVPILNPLPTLYHPSGSSQCTSPKHPVSCIEPRLATRFLYDIILFNAILPNHPTLTLSQRVQKTVLYICVSFAGLHTGLSLSFF